MFMQTKIAIFVFIRYVVWAAGMPKMLSRPGFLPDLADRAYIAFSGSLAVVCCYI